MTLSNFSYIGKYKTRVVLLVVFLCLLGIVVFRWSGRPAVSDDQKVVEIGQSEYTVSVADDEVERAQGLSGVKSLEPDQGMLFIFAETETHSFWMKDMLFPLDFVWIRDGKVVDLTENVPPPSPVDEELLIYRPHEPVDAVLEINAGEIESNDLRIGDRVIVK